MSKHTNSQLPLAKLPIDALGIIMSYLHADVWPAILTFLHADRQQLVTKLGLTSMDNQRVYFYCASIGHYQSLTWWAKYCWWIGNPADQWWQQVCPAELIRHACQHSQSDFVKLLLELNYDRSQSLEPALDHVALALDGQLTGVTSWILQQPWFRRSGGCYRFRGDWLARLLDNALVLDAVNAYQLLHHMFDMKLSYQSVERAASSESSRILTWIAEQAINPSLATSATRALAQLNQLVTD